MSGYATIADRDAIENEMRWEDRNIAKTMHKYLANAALKYGRENAVSFQIFSANDAKAETLSWQDLHEKVCQAANMFRTLGVGEDDVVAYVLPNCNETVISLLGGMVAGIVSPINPLLEPKQMAALLRETGASVVVTLKSLPKIEIAQNVAQAVEMSPNVKTVLEVDLVRYLSLPKSWIVPLIRPKNPARHGAKVLDFNIELDRHSTELAFEDSVGDRVAAYFHTGGTTGMPKIVQHRYSGMIYNGWLGHQVLYRQKDNVLCPLPLFHVFACHVVLMGMIDSGAHVIFPTPAGYRGDGVFENFWKLVERWGITFVIGVPTAMAALMQRPVDADVSSVNLVFSGSSPLPIELYHKFEGATGTEICEGYGLTESTCLVAANPPDGEKRIGSIGFSFPYSDVKIFDCADDGTVIREMEVDEIGEICVSNPGVFVGHTYTDEAKNVGLYVDGKYLRTGDLGRIDPDGYIWITGRAKDLIIRGGHNIDPAEIEEALAGHDAVALVGAIGQPDSFAGELPCVYVELVAGAEATPEELMAFANLRVHERAARPKHIEVISEMPKTAVGKVFKPELRKRAIQRVYNLALLDAGIAAEVTVVVEDKKRGLVAQIKRAPDLDENAVAHALGEFTRPWDLID